PHPLARDRRGRPPPFRLRTKCISIETLRRRPGSDAMRGMGVYDQMKKAFQDLIAPELHAIRGEIRVLGEKIDSVDARLSEKIASVDARLTTRIDALRTEVVSLKAELLAEIRRLDARIDGVDRELRTAIDIRERLAALEARRAV